MATSNKFEAVTVTDLKQNDKVTVVNLADGKVCENATVSYKYGSEFEITTTAGGLRYFGSAAAKNLVIVRAVKPDNWPPKPNDVWLIGGYVWHALGSAATVHFRRASSASTSAVPENILKDYGSGKAELLYRR